jgi:multidrug resistance protein, MATE family
MTDALTHARVLRIAFPIVLANATIPLLGLVDTAVVGQMGQAAPIGAVGLGAIALATVYWIFGFLRMGTSGLVAQATGAGDRAEQGAILLRALMVAGAAGVVLIAGQALLMRAAVAAAPASAEVEGLMRQYLAIRIWGAPATIALYAITGWLVGQERTRGVLVLQVVQNGLNVGLDLWFVLGLGWGVAGVAASTLIAEYAGLALGLWLCRGAFGAALRPALGRLRDRAALVTMFRINRDIMIRSVLLQLSFTTFLFLGARHGDVTLAANQVLLQFLEVTAYALDGFAFAAEALVGQAVGALAVARVRAAMRLTMQWGVIGAAVLALSFAIGGTAIIDLMTTSPEVRSEARAYLPWLIAAPLVGVAAWIYDGIYIGATLTGLMLRTIAVSVAAYVVALMLLMPPFGNHGLWAALMVLNLVRGLTMWWASPAVTAKAAG